MRLCRLWKKSVNSERHIYVEVVVVVVAVVVFASRFRNIIIIKNHMFLLSRSFPH